MEVIDVALNRPEQDSLVLHQLRLDLSHLFRARWRLVRQTPDLDDLILDQFHVLYILSHLPG